MAALHREESRSVCLEWPDHCDRQCCVSTQTGSTCTTKHRSDDSGNGHRSYPCGGRCLMLQIPLFVNAAAPASYDEAQKRAGTTGSCFAKKRQMLAALSFSIGGHWHTHWEVSMDRNLVDESQRVHFQSAVHDIPVEGHMPDKSAVRHHPSLFDMTLVLTVGFSLFEL